MLQIMVYGIRLEWKFYGKEGNAAKGKERPGDCDGTSYIVKWFLRMTADGCQHAIVILIFLKSLLRLHRDCAILNNHSHSGKMNPSSFQATVRIHTTSYPIMTD